ncbi:hypothetical protein ACFOY2_45690 [Nonomuraea purpurea]|uniref:Uncharacterized protein n=1 Tax=Nonomuraea purpurea TaxID=1849276 RepID=A0ABV8GNR1_9ACTN
MTGDQVARLGVSNAAAHTINRLLNLVSTVDDDRREPGDLTREALNALKTMNKVVARCIMTDTMRGTLDEDLAALFGVDEFTFVRQYGHLNKTHMVDNPQGLWGDLRPTCPAEIHDSCPDDPATAAHHLDQWMSRHLDPREAAPAPTHPVSARL